MAVVVLLDEVEGLGLRPCDGCLRGLFMACCIGEQKDRALTVLGRIRAEGMPLSLETYQAYTRVFGESPSVPSSVDP